MVFKTEIDNIKNQIVEKYNPADIYLFGSQAKGLIKEESDIDLCVIINSINKRQLLQEMLYELDYLVDLDIVIFTEEEWKKNRDDLSTFASIINKTGVSLLGRYN